MLIDKQPFPVPPATGVIAGGAGDGAASLSADAIYVEHRQLLRRVAIRKFNVPAAEADELVQDVFINLLVTRRTIRTDLRGYLVAAISNACRNYWRSRKSEGRVFADDDLPGVDTPTDDLLADLERNLTVASTLAKLGARCREALRRYYLNGETTPAIAAMMKTTPGNVNYMMHVCRKRAREIYVEITRIR